MKSSISGWHSTRYIEQARQYGVRQAMQFLIEVHDEPTLAREVGIYVLPSRQWRKALRKALGKPRRQVVG